MSLAHIQYFLSNSPQNSIPTTHSACTTHDFQPFFCTTHLYSIQTLHSSISFWFLSCSYLNCSLVSLYMPSTTFCFCEHFTCFCLQHYLITQEVEESSLPNINLRHRVQTQVSSSNIILCYFVYCMDFVVIQDKSLFNLKASMLFICYHISINILKILYFIFKCKYN